ncbi:MAG TPA: translation initiation factor eIF-1A [Candidatus Poseidoniales archaeon]|nr:translation initiation factor eIF-1A [Candidatus Poseidoniales archaeon]
MGRRREEKVDVEELARLESPEGGTGGKIRVKMPNKKVNEMFALAEQILGGRRVSVLCADGETRLARIPGKMRRRQWVREGDLIIVWPWDFQDAKADVKHRYSKTQSMYLSRKGVLPEAVDMFGMNTRQDDDDEFDDLFGNANDMAEESAADEAAEDTTEDVVDETDDLFASEEESAEEQSQPEVAEESAADEAAEEPTQVIADEPLDDDDDDDDDIDALFA